VGTPPDALLRLVDRFSQDYKVFLLGDYKEEQLRAALPTDLCLPIRHSDFGIRAFLGMPVIHEESIKVAGATKAPHYAFTTSPAANVLTKRSAE
jgi:hypothetical protein